ncbi:carbohydrate esterase family 1 protein [Leptodontidium sp. MPI-SDFR-AT-0119]|nr:carbohydrate esterase family 1 protein [Leptodontidium sp. MPI-SDFR-AT-0119]
MPSFNSALAGFSMFLSLLSSVSSAANPLIQIREPFGSNPTNVSFYLYLPKKIAPNPPILVNPHWCHGTAQAAFEGTQLATLADTYGYIMIFPNSPNAADQCWDVSSPQTLSHNGGGDSQGIVSMVKWTLEKYKGDARRVFSMGTSSGAMMTNVLLGSYPDVFAAGSAWAGVAFGCYAANGYAVWSDSCATGKIIKTGAEWKAIVEAAYPGYTGWRPKMQVFHGTADDILYPQNLHEEIKEWTAVLGLPSTPVKTLPNDLQSGWTTYIYGDKFMAVSAEDVTHNIQTNATEVLRWFDLTCTGPGCFSRPGGPVVPISTTVPIPTTLTTSKGVITTSIKSTATATPTGAAQVKWGQCGGLSWSGPTACVSGTTCTFSNPYYSQCL